MNALVRDNGVFKSDSKIYVSLAHDEKDVSNTIGAFKTAAMFLQKDRAVA